MVATTAKNTVRSPHPCGDDLSAILVLAHMGATTEGVWPSGRLTVTSGELRPRRRHAHHASNTPDSRVRGRSAGSPHRDGPRAPLPSTASTRVQQSWSQCRIPLRRVATAGRPTDAYDDAIDIAHSSSADQTDRSGQLRPGLRAEGRSPCIRCPVERHGAIGQLYLARNRRPSPAWPRAVPVRRVPCLLVDGPVFDASTPLARRGSRHGPSSQPLRGRRRGGSHATWSCWVVGDRRRSALP